MWTHRLFLHLLQLRRSGHKFPFHPDIDVHPGDQAVNCFGCPRPGFNFEWREVTPEERYVYAAYNQYYLISPVTRAWFRFWASFDGNARSVRKNKRVDAGDICLSDNLGYFPQKQPYREWTETVKPSKRWVSSSILLLPKREDY